MYLLRFLSLLIIGKEVRAKQQEEKKERAAEISQDDLDDLEKNKKNSTARRRYLKVYVIGLAIRIRNRINPII